MNTLLFAIWFFLPAGLANAAPVVAKKLPFFRDLEAPLDFGKKFRGRRIFGPNKTWRGPITGIIVASFVVFLEYWLHRNSATIRSLIVVDYCQTKILWLGPLFGLGALTGDALESFFKRQFRVRPGEKWFPFDQIDYIVGGLAASLIVIRLSLNQYLVIIIVWFIAHLIGSYVGYKLNLKDKPI